MAAQGSGHGGDHGAHGGGRGAGYNPGFHPGFDPGHGRGRGHDQFPPRGRGRGQGYGGFGYFNQGFGGAGAGVHRAAMEEGSAEAEVVGAGQTLAAPATNHLRRRSWEAATCRSNQQGHPLSQTRSRGGGAGRCAGGCSPTDTSNGVIAAGDLDYFEQVSTGIS